MPWAQVGHTGEDKHARDVPFLDSYANKQWEVIMTTPTLMMGGVN